MRRLKRGRKSAGRESSLAPALAFAFCASLAARETAAAPLELVVNGTFDTGVDPWLSTPNLVLEADAGRLCANVPAGSASLFEVVLAEFGLQLVAGEQYRLSYLASSGSGRRAIATLVQAQDPPFLTSFFRQGVVEATPARFEHFFTAPSDAASGLFFFLGGAAEAWRFCIDDVSLLSETRYAPDTGPRVRVNQVGYLPSGPKSATLVTDATQPLPFRLLDARGRTLLRGKSVPRGLDATSGLATHELHFDRYRGRGRGFTLASDGETSHPFDIANDVYESLRRDSLFVFYTQRSGTPIEASVAGAAHARAAGHAGVSPNLGDTAVSCQAPEVSQPIYGEPWTCDYTLDVAGGWYDAGDHGKYVVNGGIATAQLLSTYERTLHVDDVARGALGDGTLRVPEHANGVPDILDEARWELEWMLKMQVPEGLPLAGMAHHKVHDFGWTGLPLDPAADPKLRELHRPSTAATLNLAAVTAQGSRLYRAYDQPFAARLLAAARRAWQAALATPALYAPLADGANGGGPYDDDVVTDEFYWAATELYITTGEATFEQAILASPVHTADVFDVDGFYWGELAPLARMQLARYGRRLSGRAGLRDSVLDAADELVALAAAQPWGQPYAPASGVWVWGSTAQLLNNLMLLGTAHDLSGRDEYRDAVLEGLDFILGRNALDRSFVVGYGTRSSRNLHSRMYGAQLDPLLPPAPPGTLSGGPNSELQDPFAAALLEGCPPQLCYVDDIESWSTNELAINWNAALAWVASFAADQGACSEARGEKRGLRVRSR